jgi:tRNA 5-methylaminomethyl-2-thiouridine biosynthesis bifunctional protein
LSGSAVAHSLAQRGWAVTVIDQGTAEGAGASGLPAGLAAPHVSPDDNVLSRITRAGVRATLQRAQDLLQPDTDWALSGVLEHNLAGKRRLPKRPNPNTADNAADNAPGNTPSNNPSNNPSNAPDSTGHHQQGGLAQQVA